MKLNISDRVRRKLTTKHGGVSDDEIIQCFANRGGRFLIDTREDHHTDPPTQWLIAETDYGKLLKVVFILKNGMVEIKTAYQPNQTEIDIYNRWAK